MKLKSLFWQSSAYVVLMTLSVTAQELNSTNGFVEATPFAPVSPQAPSVAGTTPDIPVAGQLPATQPQMSPDATTPIQPIARKQNKRFKLSPYAAASVGYSDNLALTNDANKESGMIYSAGGGVNGSYQSKKLDAVGGVGITHTRRTNDTHFTAPSANGAVSSELVNNLLYLDALGSIQGMRGGPNGADSFSGAANSKYYRYNTVTISPYLRKQFGQKAVGELRYGYDYGGGTVDTIGTIQSHTYKGSLGTSNKSARLNVNGSAAYTDINYDDPNIGSNDATQFTKEVTATYALTRQLTAIGQVGHDDIETQRTSLSRDLSGTFYNGGLQYMPSEKLRLTGRLGRRNNAKYYVFDGNYNVTKRVFVGATAMTQLQSAIPLGYRGPRVAGTALNPQGQVDANGNPISLAQQVEQSLNLPGGGVVPNAGQGPIGSNPNADFYRSQSLLGYLGMNMPKGDVGVAVGYEDRNFDIATDQVLTTATVHYRHNFTSKISGTVEGFYYGLDGLAEETSDTYGARLLGNYALNDQVNLFTAVGRTERKAEQAVNDFTEHNVTAGVSTQF